MDRAFARVGIRLHVGPSAFGNALGNGIIDTIKARERAAFLAADQMRAGREDAAAYNDAWRGGTGAEPLSRVAAERMQYGGMSQRELLQGDKDWLRALGPYGGSLNGDNALAPNFGTASTPQMLFATDRSIVQNRGAKDIQRSEIVEGQQVVTRETRLGVDSYLDFAQSYVSEGFTEMDDIASAAGATTSSQVFAAGTYGLRRIAEHTINGLIGIPRLATSPTIVPSLVKSIANPTRTAGALATHIGGMSTQDKLVFGLEVALPFKGNIEGLAGRIPGAGKYLQGTLGYSQNYGVTLAADGKLFGSISDVPDGFFKGPLGRQRGAVVIGGFGEIRINLADVLSGNGEVRLSATQLRNSPGVATVSSELTPASGRWLDASVPTPIPAQVADSLAGKTFNTFGDLRKSIWEQIGSNPDLNSGFSRANLAKMNDGLSPSAPTSYLNETGAFGDTFNIHHANPIENGGLVYNFSNLQIVSPKIHYDIHYVPTKGTP